MENSLITSLDQVIISIKKLKKSYADLEDKVKEYEEEIELLKVEVEIYQEELTNIKITTENKNVGLLKDINPPINLSPSDASKEVENTEQSKLPTQTSSDNNEQLKIQLDGFIEEIDQCIKTIVTKK